MIGTDPVLLAKALRRVREKSEPVVQFCMESDLVGFVQRLATDYPARRIEVLAYPPSHIELFSGKPASMTDDQWLIEAEALQEQYQGHATITCFIVRRPGIYG